MESHLGQRFIWDQKTLAQNEYYIIYATLMTWQLTNAMDKMKYDAEQTMTLK